MMEASYGSEEPPHLTTMQRNLMKTAQPQFATSQTIHHDCLKMPATHIPLLTSMTSRTNWAYLGNETKTYHLDPRPPSLVFSGTSRPKQLPSQKLRRPNTLPQSLHGNLRRLTASRKSRSYMANSSMLVQWSQLGELTSPAWRNSWPSLVTILSCHTPPLAALTTIYTGGSKPSPAPTSPAPSQVPKSSSTLLLTQMLAQKLVLASLSETAGEHGVSYQDGKRMGETLAGLKPLASSSLSSPYFQAALQAQISKSLETTKVLSRAGGKEGAIILPQTRSSNSYMTKATVQASSSTPVTSQARTTLLMIHPMESMGPETSSYHPSPSHLHTGNWLSTLMKNLAQSSLAGPITGQLQSHFQNPTKNPNNEQEQSSTAPLRVRQRSSLHKCKAGSDAICHPATLPLPPPRNSRPSPYSDNLRPLPSVLCPHVLARDRIRLWKPVTSRNNLDPNGHPTNLTALDLKRITDVMEIVWEPSTLEGYGSGLLTYHVWCDIRAIPEEQQAPLSPIIASAFVSTLAGAYSWKTIRNYLYGIHTWHIFHGVKWEMNELEMEALLRAAEKATPESSKWKKRLPYTLVFILAIQAQLDLNNPFEAAVHACLTTIFYACAQVGEFTVSTLTAFKADCHIKPSDISTEHDRNGLKSTAFQLPQTKTSIHRESVSWSRQNNDTDPERALSHHLALNQPPQNGPLFAYKYKNTHHPLTKLAFIKALATAATKAGLNPMQGHGICIGSMLKYLLQGVPFEVVKVKGRWASNAFLIYLTKHAQILAPYMQAQPELHAEFVHITMPCIWAKLTCECLSIPLLQFRESETRSMCCGTPTHRESWLTSFSPESGHPAGRKAT